ncbi:MAG: hypothetical protein JNL62_16150 [Bryobacterales bacterium]|nr:hypothetical protein [Bryobacterales bacterium]
MDVQPTLASVAGLPAPAGRVIDGQDLTPMLDGKPSAGSAYKAFYSYHMNQLRAVRQGDWKLHVSGELYNLAADISESKNVAADNPRIVARLKGSMEEARADLGDGSHNGPRVRPMARPKGRYASGFPVTPSLGTPPRAPVKKVPGAPYL